jgi:hypothetical protein
MGAVVLGAPDQVRAATARRSQPRQASVAAPPPLPGVHRSCRLRSLEVPGSPVPRGRPGEQICVAGSTRLRLLPEPPMTPFCTAPVIMFSGDGRASSQPISHVVTACPPSGSAADPQPPLTNAAAYDALFGHRGCHSARDNPGRAAIPARLRNHPMDSSRPADTAEERKRNQSLRPAGPQGGGRSPRCLTTEAICCRYTS